MSQAKYPKYLKTNAVQILHTPPLLGYLLLYKHVTYCYHSNIVRLLKLYSKLRKISITISLHC